MKIKKHQQKGFTLVEAIIALVVIGVLVTMLMSMLTKGVNEAQWKTAYRKAYTSIANLCSIEKTSGALPANADERGQQAMFSLMANNLSVKDYLAYSNADLAGKIATARNYKPCAEYLNMITQQNTTCDGSEKIVFTEGTEKGNFSPWIIMEDNIAYAIMAPDNGACESISEINSEATTTAAVNASCVTILVDVNGLSKGPNKLEPQVADENFGKDTALSTLTGDRFYIFIGSDGAAPGNKESLVTGRIAANGK